MNILIFGATGMVGQGVLRECLLDADVQRVTTIGRSPTGMQSSKLRDLVHPDLTNYSSLESELTDLDACFFCLGISNLGVSEPDYERITYGYTLAAAETLARLNPRMTFIYVSGAGADSSENGRLMWARTRGRTENAVLRLAFQGYVFRPGIIQPLHGARSRTRLYRLGYVVMGPFLTALRRILPGYVLTTEKIGRAMLTVVRHGAPKRLLESKDIEAVPTDR